MYKTKTNHKVIIHLNLASWKIQSNFRKSCIDHDKRGGLERVMKQKYSSDGRSKYTGKWIERERERKGWRVHQTIGTMVASVSSIRGLNTRLAFIVLEIFDYFVRCVWKQPFTPPRIDRLNRGTNEISVSRRNWGVNQ